MEPWDPALELASRLAKDLSGCLFDLNKKAIVTKKKPLGGGRRARTVASLYVATKGNVAIVNGCRRGYETITGKGRWPERSVARA